MIKDIKKYDESSMYNILENFFSQIKESIDLVKKSKKDTFTSYNKIIFCGMGGSAIGATFVENIIKYSINIPIYINTDYTLPNWVDNQTLAIITSYSGNTEETVSCYNQLIEKKNKPWIITSGGYLLQEAKKNNFTYVELIQNYPPRTAFGFMSSVILQLFIKNEFLNKRYYSFELNETALLIKNLSNQYMTYDRSEPLELAKFIYKKNIIIYSSPNTKAVGYRFKSQLAENAKILSYYHYFPELSHNDVEGYENLNDSLDNYVILWLIDEEDDPRIYKSIKVTSKIIDGIKNQKMIQFNQDSLLKRQYQMLYFLDCVSFYLSILYKTDPTPVKNISKIKNGISKC